jgi:hypothetical protein
MLVILATLFVEVAHRGFYAPICRVLKRDLFKMAYSATSHAG